MTRLFPLLLACVLALGLPAAHADEALVSEQHVVVELPQGRLDWTTWRLYAETSSEMAMGAWKDRRLQEQDALDSLAPRLESLARQVPVTPDTSAGDLLEGEAELARRIRDGLRRWNVDETIYNSDGGVAMAASLDLREWLRPALVSMALPEPPPLPDDAPTGVVIDARGLRFQPALAPSVVTPDGAPLVRAQLVSVDTVRMSTPVIYVTDPADPAATKRAGAEPVFARAAQSRGGELVLDAESARDLTGEPALPALVARGKVVLVVSR